MSSNNNKSFQESELKRNKSLGGFHTASQAIIKDTVDGLQEVMENLKKNRAQCKAKFVEPTYLKPENGDLIEILRKGILFYSHWGVYVGDGLIYHLYADKDGRATVKQHKLVDVAKECECRVNNMELAAEKRKLSAKPFHTIQENARNYFNIKNSKNNEYNVMEYNCEHFATYCRYGEGFSEQSCAAEHNYVFCKSVELIVDATINSSAN
jgi:kelch-like protein 24/35